MTQPNATAAKKGRKAAAQSPVVTAPAAAPKAPRKTAQRKPVAPAAQASRPTGSSPRATLPDSPSLRFHYAEHLRTKTLSVLDALEAEPAHTRHGDAVAEVVGELVEAGMDYYFMRALRQAEVGFVAEQTARVGLSGAVKLVNSMSRKFIVRMDSRQLLAVARHIRELG